MRRVFLGLIRGEMPPDIEFRQASFLFLCDDESVIALPQEPPARIDVAYAARELIRRSLKRFLKIMQGRAPLD